MDELISRLVGYYKDCFVEDNRRIVVSNFFGKRIEQARFRDKEELINGHLPYIPILKEYADELEKTLITSGGKKELYYASTFLVGGELKELNRKVAVCAPLFMFPLEIVREGEFVYVKLKEETPIFNQSILQRLSPLSTKELQEKIADFLSSETPWAKVGILTSLVDQLLPGVSSEKMLDFPLLFNKGKIANLYQDRDSKALHCVPGGAIFIMERTSEVFGVIRELEMMHEKELHSPLLRHLLLGAEYSVESLPAAESLGFLSETQRGVPRSVNKYPLTFVMGPPGTGKSHTIAHTAIQQWQSGRSVLVVAQTDQALDVIYEKITTLIGRTDVCFRMGKSVYRRETKARIKAVLRSKFSDVKEKKKDALNKSIQAVENKIQLAEKRLADYAQREIFWRKKFEEIHDRHAFLQSDLKRYVKTRNELASCIQEVVDELYYLYDERDEWRKKEMYYQYRERLSSLFPGLGNTLHRFGTFMSTEEEDKRKVIQEVIDWDVLLKMFPIWCVKMNDLSDYVPFKEDLFDLVISDESTQCNMASALPAVMRGKRLMVTGDGKQLSHFSFLAKKKQIALAYRHGLESEFDLLLDYRNSSFLDLVENKILGEQFHFLDEHYRSLPGIIEFSNSSFYEGDIKVMTRLLGGTEGALELLGAKGKEKDGVNAKEAKEVIKYVREIIKADKDLDDIMVRTIGILSPFRKQVNQLSKQIKKGFSLDEISRHKIRIGTAYDFQGDERDVMCLSLVISPESHHGTINYLEKRDVFNVSITRARRRNVVFSSVELRDLKESSLVRSFLSYCQEFESQHQKEGQIVDEALQEIVGLLGKEEFRCYEHFEMGAMAVDLLIGKNHRYLGVDLVGFEGQYEDMLSPEYLKRLRELGIDVFPLNYSYWLSHKQEFIEKVVAYFKDEL